MDFPSDATSTTILDGFTVVGGSSYVVRVRGSGVVRNCAIRSESGDATTGIHLEGSAEVADCTVEMGSGGTDMGIVAFGSGSVTDCVIDVAEGWGVFSNYGSTAITGCRIGVTDEDAGNIGVQFTSGATQPFVRDCLLTVPGGTAVELDAGTAIQCTADTADYGFVFDGVDVYNCIASNCDTYGFYKAGVSGSAEYCIGVGANGFSTGAAGTGCSTVDPLFCDAAGGEYTLRVDSYGNPDINGSAYGRIGAFDVVCMYGTLARDTVFGGSGTLEFRGDATVPSGKTLTLGPATIVRAPDGDSQAGGSNSGKTELIVAGTLRIQGESGSPVTFTSAEASKSEGDWYGIDVQSGGAAFLDYPQVRYAITGIRFTSPDSSRVTHGEWQFNQSNDLYFSGVSAAEPVLVDSNQVVVGGGTGIRIQSSCPGLTVKLNDIDGTGSSAEGILLTSSPGAATVEGNTIDDFSNGEGIQIDGDSPTVLKNAIDNCKYGIYVGGGSASIGTSSSSSDNIVTNCTNGVRVIGTGVAPVIRNNTFSTNTYGVMARSNGNPDIGTGSSDLGNNTFTANTSYCINNTSAGVTVLAYGNYYGGSCPATCTNGNVLTLGCLTTQPASVRRPDIARIGEATGLRVLGARPNPTGDASTIHFALEDGYGDLTIQVFDVGGRLVRTLPGGRFDPGEHAVAWDGRNALGRTVRTGIYFVRIAGGDALRGTAKVLVAR